MILNTSHCSLWSSSCSWENLCPCIITLCGIKYDDKQSVQTSSMRLWFLVSVGYKHVQSVFDMTNLWQIYSSERTVLPSNCFSSTCKTTSLPAWTLISMLSEQQGPCGMENAVCWLQLGIQYSTIWPLELIGKLPTAGFSASHLY